MFCLIIAWLWKDLSRFTLYHWNYDLFFFPLIVLALKKCLKVWVFCIFIKSNTCFQYVLNPNMYILTTQEIPFFRLVICAIFLFFRSTYAITFFIDSFFVCKEYVVTILEFFCLKWENSLFREIVKIVVILFASKFIIFVIVCLSLFWFSCLEAPLCTTIVVIVKHVFKRNLTCLTQLFNCFYLLFFIMYPQYLLSQRASALVHPHLWDLLFYDRKYVLSYNLHAMGGIRKKGWLWDFLISFSFRWLQKLTSGTFGWMF